MAEKTILGIVAGVAVTAAVVGGVYYMHEKNENVEPKEMVVNNWSRSRAPMMSIPMYSDRPYHDAYFPSSGSIWGRDSMWAHRVPRTAHHHM